MVRNAKCKTKKTKDNTTQLKLGLLKLTNFIKKTSAHVVESALPLDNTIFILCCK